jgi:hypothetical protein
VSFWVTANCQTNVRARERCDPSRIFLPNATLGIMREWIGKAVEEAVRRAVSK